MLSNYVFHFVGVMTNIMAIQKMAALVTVSMKLLQSWY